MKLYIADVQDTLRIIADKYRINLASFAAANPHIVHPDKTILGQYVNIPAHEASSEDGEGIELPFCPPNKLQSYMDHWIPTLSLEQMENTEYDVLVVGTGAGGGAVIWRMCEQWGKNNKKVGVIEAGNPLLPTHQWNIATLGSGLSPHYMFNPAIMQPIGDMLPDLSGAVEVIALGGKTLFWGTVSPRMNPSEIAGWPVTLDEMDLYYTIAENEMSVNTGFAAGSSLQEILLGRLQAHGFSNARNAPMAVDLASTKYGEIHSNSAFSSVLFLARALNLHPFDLGIQARAVQVLMDNERVSGVKVVTPYQKPFTIKAKTIVLSTGALETPRLLLNSGVKGRAIGHYFTNHSFLAAKGILDTTDFPEITGVLNLLVPQSEQHPYQIQINGPGIYNWYQQYQVKPSLKEWFITLLGFGRIESRYENKVFLDPTRRDRYGMPELAVRFSYSQKDKEVVRQTEQGIRKAASALGFPLAVVEGLPEICRVLPGGDFHESGTCRMGDNPSTSATNRYGQVHGISGLYVADNSILPSIGAANPTLSTVALAIRTADHIINTLQ